MERRKKQNRVAAQRSRDARKNKMKNLEQENMNLNNEIKRVSNILHNHMNQLYEINRIIKECLCIS